MLHIIFKILFIIIYFYELGNGVFGISINSSNDFINGISNGDENLSLENDIKVDNNNIIKVHSKKVIISGKSKNTILQFTNKDSVNISFLESCEEIKLNNLSIIGIFKFNNNKNIIFNNVIFNGYFISENNNDISENSRIQLLDSEFYLVDQYGFEIHNYHLTIKNSQIYGNDILNASLMSIINDETSIKNVIIDNSYFTGNYHNSAINIKYSDITCSNSIFEKFYNGKELNSGGALDLTYTNNTFNNNTFIDNFSHGSGGSIYFKYPIDTFIDDISFKNSTSLNSGGAFSMFNIDEGEYLNATISNIIHIGNIKRNKYITEGTFFSISGLINLRIDNYNGYNINTGSVMTFEGDGIFNITRMNIDEVYTQDDGAVIKAYSPKLKGIKGYFKYFNIESIVQENTSYSPAFISTDSGRIQFEHLNVTSVKGIKSGFLYSEDQASTEFLYSEISNFYSRDSEPLFYINNVKPCDPNSIHFDYVKINNVYENGVLFYVNECPIVIDNSDFNNIHECYKYNDCSSFNEISEVKDEFAIMYLEKDDKKPYFYFKDCSFNEIYGKRGLYVKVGSFEFFNNNVTNSYFQYGFLYYTNSFIIYGFHNYENVTFVNNRSEIGTFFYFDDIGNKKNIIDLNFYNIQFINNTASSYGGVLYSNARKQTDLSKYVFFHNCTYENNNAIVGKISYIYDDSHAPSYDEKDLDYINELKLDKNNFVTNPTHLKFDNFNETDVLVVHSDELIDVEYSCSIYDDYGNKFAMSDSINGALLEDLIIYELSLINVENEFMSTKIYGSQKGYCINSECKIKDLRLVGQPGDYKLELKIVSFGRYFEFRDNTLEMNVTILECDETIYINQDKNGINIKSCYKPVCNPVCVNNGKCINNNVCDCSETFFKGSTCSERYKQPRVNEVDLIFNISSSALIIITIIITIILYIKRHHEFIKSANYDFLNMILFGVILNLIFVILSTKENVTNFDCKVLYFLKNYAYSIIYGAIIAKTFTIYYIFFLLKKRNNKSVISIIKFGPITFLLVTHTLIIFLLSVTKSIKSEVLIDSQEREYIECDYSKVSILSSIINIATIGIGSFIAYGIRKVDKKFKEPLSVPIYSYVTYLILYYIMKGVNNNRLTYYFNSGGTLMYSIVILYFLYIVKFIDINFEEKMKKINGEKRLSIVKQF